MMLMTITALMLMMALMATGTTMTMMLGVAAEVAEDDDDAVAGDQLQQHLQSAVQPLLRRCDASSQQGVAN